MRIELVAVNADLGLKPSITMAYLLHGLPNIQGSVRGLFGAEGEQGGVDKGSGRLTGSIGSHGPKDCLYLMGS